MEHGHRLAERRSIALHGLVAERLDDETVERARRRVEDWLVTGAPVPRETALRWRAALELPRPELAELLTRDDEDSRDLRQSTPFAGVVPSSERWAMLRAVR